MRKTSVWLLTIDNETTAIFKEEKKHEARFHNRSELGEEDNWAVSRLRARFYIYIVTLQV